MADDIQELVATVPFLNGNNNVATDSFLSGMEFFVPLFMPGGPNNRVPGYWSRHREKYLRNLVSGNDALKIAVKTFISKACTIPPRVTAIDNTIQRHITLAKAMEDNLLYNSGLRKGYNHVIQKYLYDYLTQDNGAFMLVLGEGNLAGPIVGRAMGLYHLDSQRCTRTNNAEFPVIYTDTDGKRYKLHYTRVIEQASLPSPDLDLNGVGMCAVSLCLESATELQDIARYVKEKLGSRPPRQVLYARKGATIDQLTAATEAANRKLDGEGLSFFSRTLMLAPNMAGQELILDVLDLSSAPDGFERQSVTMLNMAVVAAAFGLDLRDLAHAFGVAGATKADAEVQHMKGRGKGVGEWVEEFARLLDQKFLPDSLNVNYDYVDDAQDEQVARIWAARSEARFRDISSNAKTVRATRMAMYRQGEITEDEFEAMELEDGRLPNGMQLISLFSSSDPDIERLLTIEGIEDPTNIQENDPEEMMDLIHQAQLKVWEEYDVATATGIRRKVRQAAAALEQLYDDYETKLTGAVAPSADGTPPQLAVGVAAAERTGEDEQDGDPPETGPHNNQGTNSNPNEKPGVEKALRIIPDGSDKNIPDVPEEVVIQSSDKRRASRVFDKLIPNFSGLLNAKVEDESK